MMQILVLLGRYFDTVVVFVTSQTLLFRLALAILCLCHNNILIWQSLQIKPLGQVKNSIVTPVRKKNDR